ncbi:hypothetical protein [Nannocystis bainbridge]|uniref:hypothetical protein n=1 Tax=Nannocystis bainbridge TaxID=2995303 RepID=UPI00232BF237|nr:hypothetical protein [Nannocystis bainbridge]
MGARVYARAPSRRRRLADKAVVGGDGLAVGSLIHSCRELRGEHRPRALASVEEARLVLVRDFLAIGVSSRTAAACSSHHAKKLSTIGRDFSRRVSSRFFRGAARRVLCARSSSNDLEPANRARSQPLAHRGGADRRILALLLTTAAPPVSMTWLPCVSCI